MLDKLRDLESRYDELSARLGTPEIQSDPAEYRKAAKTLAELEPLVQTFREFKRVEHDIAGAEELVRGGDPEMRELAQEELSASRERRERLEQELKLLLIPKDPNDEKNVILEIRAGEGGAEAALFAADLFRMYSRYADRQGWKLEVMSTSDSPAGGLKEIIASVGGRGVYSRMKYESGVHRVQRVPATEASGRIHTSTATVAVLPEAEDVDIQINEKDLKIDTFCSSGPGGQSVNTTYSAVRITHIPTGTVVACQEERSQLKNRQRAMALLRARIYEAQKRAVEAARAAERKEQVGTGDRSDRIRTYNFPQDRLTDHRLNRNYSLTQVMEGKLDPVVDALIADMRERRIEEL
jgi:peptide chain release factor 1